MKFTVLRFINTLPMMFFLFALAFAFTPFSVVTADAQSSVRPPERAVSPNADEPSAMPLPGGTRGFSSDADYWRGVREGVNGTVSIPDTLAGTLVQSDGWSWRKFRSGPFFDYLGMGILGTLILLALFFALRGRIRVEHGMAGQTITRFSMIERMGHWLMAVSFIILGLTGLNISFGKELIMPIIGKELFGPMTYYLKLVHNYVAFAFMLGLAINFVTWVIHNIPNRHDIVWLAKAGGLFSKGVHPPSRKFNAGQKIIFWSVMLGGLSLFASGWALLFPFEYQFFEGTVTSLAAIGIDLPGLIGLPEPPYSVIQEQQFNSIWHALVAVVMICIILAHIYIGSVGMEGAFDAMGSGEVDLNWAKEHHNLWVEEVQEKETKSAAAQPAE